MRRVFRREDSWIRPCHLVVRCTPGINQATILSDDGPISAALIGGQEQVEQDVLRTVVNVAPFKDKRASPAPPQLMALDAATALVLGYFAIRRNAETAGG